MREAAKPGLEVEPVAESEKAGGQAGATTMVGAAISKDIRNSSSKEERTTSVDHDIGEDTRLTSRA